MPKTVLIADDRASMRRSVRFLLERRHAELVVQEAVDGIDAVEKAKQTPTGLDNTRSFYARPEWSGSGDDLEKYSPNTPIILFTMYTDLHADSSVGFLAWILFRKWTVFQSCSNELTRCYHQLYRTDSLICGSIPR